MLKNNFDLITITTRTPVPYQLMISALSAFVKALVVEKPLTNSLKDSYEIIQKITENNCLLGYGTTRRAMDIYRTAFEIIKSGELGDLISITAEFGKSKLLWSLP